MECRPTRATGTLRFEEKEDFHVYLFLTTTLFPEDPSIGHSRATITSPQTGVWGSSNMGLSYPKCGYRYSGRLMAGLDGVRTMRARR